MRQNQLHKCYNYADYLFRKMFSHNFYATTFFKCYKKVAQCDKKTFFLCVSVIMSACHVNMIIFLRGKLTFIPLKLCILDLRIYISSSKHNMLLVKSSKLWSKICMIMNQDITLSSLKHIFIYLDEY